MRKITAALLAVLLVLTLSGCTAFNNTEKGLDFLVSSIGFDQKDDVFSVHLETLTVNSEDSEPDKKLTLITGSGKNLTEALDDAYKKSMRPFLYSHCAVAVIGEGISEKGFRNICTFLYNRDEINLSLRFVYTKNAETLLNCDTVASVAVGYDLADALKFQKDLNGTVYKNRFYEIEALRRNYSGTFALPRFSVEDKKHSITGLTVFKNDLAVIDLSIPESVIYSAVTSAIKNGNILLNHQNYTLNNASIKKTFNLNENLNTKITLKLNLQGDGNIKPQITETITQIYNLSKEKGADVFMLANEIAIKKPDLWRSLKHNFPLYYKNSSLEVTVI